jgi:hypothetical protein
MTDDELTPQRVATLTAAVDIEASPPDGEPVALVLFGTNQAAPAQIAAARYHADAAPLVIATGGINRHTGIIEGREFARLLTAAGVPGDMIRVEDQSKDTWQNVELSLPHLREALALGLRLAVVSKWYHLRTVNCLATQLPEAAPFYAISWEPVYAGTLVTRASWPKIPDGRRRVLRESQEIPAASPKEPTAPPARLTAPGSSPDARAVPTGGGIASMAMPALEGKDGPDELPETSGRDPRRPGPTVECRHTGPQPGRDELAPAVWGQVPGPGSAVLDHGRG